MEHEDNEHWWLAEYSKGEVGYVPVSYLIMIVDDNVHEEGCDKTRTEGQENSTDSHRTKIGEEMRQDGGRRKKYSAAVIDGYRNSKRMAINGMMKRLFKEEDVGYVDLWDSFVGERRNVREGRSAP